MALVWGKAFAPPKDFHLEGEKKGWRPGNGELSIPTAIQLAYRKQGQILSWISLSQNEWWVCGREWDVASLFSDTAGRAASTGNSYFLCLLFLDIFNIHHRSLCQSSALLLS